MSVQQRTAPFVGFGSRGTAGWVGFGILRTDTTTTALPDFVPSLVAVSKHVPGGNLVKTQILGQGPQQATWTIECDTLADFQRLTARLGDTDTLCVPSGATAVAGDEWVNGGITYIDLANVTLLALASVVVDLDGTVQAAATFQRVAS